MSERVVHDPLFKHKLAFSETEHEGRPATRVEMWVEPGGGVPAHVHPSIEERFTVLEGVAQFLSGRRWITAKAGETAVIPPGTRHAYRNRGKAQAHVVCIATPASKSLEEFLTTAAEMGRQGMLTKSGLPKRLSAILPAVALAHRHREMATMGFPLPPKAVQRALFPLLARLGERRGRP